MATVATLPRTDTRTPSRFEDGWNKTPRDYERARAMALTRHTEQIIEQDLRERSWGVAEINGWGGKRADPEPVPLDIPALAKAYRRDPSALYKALKSMIDKGIVRQEGDRYSINDDYRTWIGPDGGPLLDVEQLAHAFAAKNIHSSLLRESRRPRQANFLDKSRQNRHGERNSCHNQPQECHSPHKERARPETGSSIRERKTTDGPSSSSLSMGSGSPEPKTERPTPAETPRMAPPEEIAQVASLAAAVWGPGAAVWVVEACRDHGSKKVRQLIEETIPRWRSGRVDDPRKYVFGTLKKPGFTGEAPPARPTPTPPKIEYHKAEPGPERKFGGVWSSRGGQRHRGGVIPASPVEGGPRP